MARPVGDWTMETEEFLQLKGCSLDVIALKVAWHCCVYTVWLEWNKGVSQG